MEILIKHINQPGRDPRDVKPNLDDAVHALLVKAIERDVGRRFQTAADFRKALRALEVEDESE
jgi:hypothetical protein